MYGCCDGHVSPCKRFLRSISGRLRKSAPSSQSRSKAYKTGLPLRDISALNWLTPTSPSRMAFCTGSLPRDFLKTSNDLKRFRLRETSLHSLASMYAIARKPSCFSSKEYLSVIEELGSAREAGRGLLLDRASGKQNFALEMKEQSLL
jgi:hypothetical protein